jgi:hypothetical protein
LLRYGSGTGFPPHFGHREDSLKFYKELVDDSVDPFTGLQVAKPPLKGGVVE